VTAGVLQQACDCVLSVDMVAVRIDVRGELGAATCEFECAIEVFVSFKAVVRGIDLSKEDRDVDAARTTDRIILWTCICQTALSSLSVRSYPAVMMSPHSTELWHFRKPKADERADVDKYLNDLLANDLE
jgi:hypothetical protein